MSIDVNTELVTVLRRHGLLGADLLVALSGGLDSVCLVRLLAGVRDRHGGRLEVAHVDHALRRESGDDAGFCRSLSRELGCPFHLRRLGPGVLAGGGGRQAEARRERREFFEAVAARRGLEAVALGHHAGDQVETVLFRLLRGAGPRGARAMAEFSQPYLRPLLNWDRAKLRELVATHRWAYREDPTNQGDRYARNRLRNQVLPLLEQVHPGAAAGLLRFARLAAEDDRVLTRLTREAVGRLVAVEAEGLRLPVAGVAGLDVPLRRRVYLALWDRLGFPPEVLHSRHLDAVDALLQPGRAHRFAPIPGPGRFAVSYDQLWLLALPPQQASPVEFRLPGPGCPGVPTPAGVLRWGRAPPGDGTGIGVPAGPDPEVWVHTRRPGDRVARPGHGPRKLKDLLIDARLPLWRRTEVLVVGDGDGAFGALGRGFAWGGGEPARGWLWIEPEPRAGSRG